MGLEVKLEKFRTVSRVSGIFLLDDACRINSVVCQVITGGGLNPFMSFHFIHVFIPNNHTSGVEITSFIVITLDIMC